jgi:Oxidoreductase molybdopterin binding domain
MRMGFWALAILIGLGLGAIGAQGNIQAQSQTVSGGNGAAPGGQAAPGGEMGMKMARPAFPAGPLKITFEDKSAEWTPATLVALPHKTITVYNEHAKTNQTYSGVPLIDLLKPLGVPDKPHGKEFRLYLVAEGSDGYQVVYSLGEITPDVHDATALVADTMDGKSIADDGPLKLVATGETRPARWVRNLVAIRVRTAE